MVSVLWFANVFQTVAAMWFALKALLVKRLQAGQQFEQVQPEASEASAAEESPTHDSGKISKRQKKNQKKAGKVNVPEAEENQEPLFENTCPEIIEEVSQNKVSDEEEILDKVAEGGDLQTVKSEVTMVDDYLTVEESENNEMTTTESEVIEVDAQVTVVEEEKTVKPDVAQATSNVTRTLPSDRQGLLKESLKLSKKLREITALEQQMMSTGARLDKLQAAKVTKKSLIEAELTYINEALAAMPEISIDSDISTKVDESSGIDSDISTKVDESSGSDANEEKDVVQVWALDEEGQPVLKFISPVSTGVPVPAWQEAELAKSEAHRVPPACPPPAYPPSRFNKEDLRTIPLVQGSTEDELRTTPYVQEDMVHTKIERCPSSVNLMQPEPTTPETPYLRPTCAPHLPSLSLLPDAAMAVRLPSPAPSTWMPKLRHHSTQQALERTTVEEAPKMPKKIPVPKAAKKIQYEIKEVDGFQIREPVTQRKETPAQKVVHAQANLTSPVELSSSELPKPPEFEAPGPPPGLFPPGLPPSTMPSVATNIKRIVEESSKDIPPPPGLCPDAATADPSPPPGLCQTARTGRAVPGGPQGSPPPYSSQVKSGDHTRGDSPHPPPGLGIPSPIPATPDMIEGSTVEVQALLQSISLELNRVACNLTSHSSDSCTPNLSRQSSESDFSTKASSGDGSHSPLSNQATSASLPVAQDANLAMMNTWANSSAMWESLNMPAWGAEYSDYSAMPGEYPTSMAWVIRAQARVQQRMMDQSLDSVPCATFDEPDCSKPSINYSEYFSGVVRMSL